MVKPIETTLIDDCGLSADERKKTEALLSNHPVPMEVVEWIDLPPIIKKTSELTRTSDAVVLVASGGLDVYKPSDKPIFVFDSKVHPAKESQRGEDGEDLKRLFPARYRPAEYHRKELDRLGLFLEKYEPKTVSVVEGDVGVSGISIARLSSIQEKVRKKASCKTIVGVAFKPRYLVFLSIPQPNPLYLSDIDPEIIQGSKGWMIRRFSETLGGQEQNELHQDTDVARRYLQEIGRTELLGDYIVLRGKARDCVAQRNERIKLYNSYFPI